MPAISSDVATGRRINGREDSFRCLLPLRSPSGRPAADRDLHAVGQLSAPSTTTRVAGLQTIVNRYIVAFGHAHFTVTNRDRVVVLNQIDKRAGRTALNGDGRTQSRRSALVSSHSRTFTN